MSIEKKKIGVVACAGMDKALGSVTRSSIFKVVEQLRPNKVELICLAPLLAGVEHYTKLVKSLNLIVVDGCVERCATKIIIKNGGHIKGRILATVSARKHGLTPKNSSDIGSTGEKLANAIAEEVASIVDKNIGE